MKNVPCSPFRTILSSADFIRFRNFAPELFERSVKWFVVSYLMYKSSDSFGKWQKVSSYTHWTTVGFVHEPNVSYYLCGTFRHFLVAIEFSNMSTEPLLVPYSLPRSMSPNPLSVFLSELTWLRKLVDLKSKFHKVDLLFQLWSNFWSKFPIAYRGPWVQIRYQFFYPSFHDWENWSIWWPNSIW